MTGEAILPKDGVFQEHTLPAKRARYYSQENNFDFSWPGVPVHQRREEVVHVLDLGGAVVGEERGRHAVDQDRRDLRVAFEPDPEQPHLLFEAARRRVAEENPEDGDPEVGDRVPESPRRAPLYNRFKIRPERAG